MPSELGFEPRSPRYDPFSVLGLVDTNSAQSRPFSVIFGVFLGHIVELQGNEELFVTGESRGTCSVATVSLRLAVLSGFQDRLGPKKAVLGHKMRSFGRATGEFSALNLDLATAPPRV